MGDRTRRLLAALTVIVAAAAIGGCGSGSPGSTAPGAAGAGFPVELDTALGPVTVPAPPARVVALDFPSADALLALGVTPVAMARVSYVDGGVQDWTRAALDGASPELFDADAEIPVERIASLKPDLIVAANSYNLEPVHARLRRIAPVVSYVEGPGADTWQQTTLLVGRALGREEEARRIVADTEAAIADAAARHPRFDGMTITLFNLFDGQAYAISSERDFSIRFLTSLGFRLPPAIERAAEGGSGEGRLAVGPERVTLLEADIVLGTSSQSQAALREFASSPLFRRLPAVRRGAYADLGIGPATAIAFPSALSTRYALDEIVPLLDRLAQGREPEG